jgi:uncharacterized membrane protein
MVKFLNPEEEQLVIQAIQQAEQQTTGEIRIHLQSKLRRTAWEDALKVFNQLNMRNTENRNAVLLFIAPNDHQLVIIGDQGIHNQVLSNFWIEVRDQVLDSFKRGEFADGICLGVRLIGEKLQAYFPADANQKNENELPDDISYE